MKLKHFALSIIAAYLCNGITPSNAHAAELTRRNLQLFYL